MILQKGKYDYELNVDGDVSNRCDLRTELAKEALKNSRNEAEQLAEVLGIRVKGVESIRKMWDDGAEIIECCMRDNLDCLSMEPPRVSDSLGVKTVKEIVNLKVKWILE